MAAWLVIGIGNSLRRDDGVGPWIAERVAEWKLPGVVVREAHQLTPELVGEIVAHERVLFVDAAAACERSGPVRISPADSSHGWHHDLEPEELLALAGLLVDQPPPAWVVPVHGVDFQLGEGFSDEARQACERALADIRDLLTATIDDPGR